MMKLTSGACLLVLSLAACPGPTDPLRETDMAASPDLAPADDLASPPDLTEVDPLAGVGQAEKVMPGMTFQFTEGPLWRANPGVLWFTDVQASQIYELTPPNQVKSVRMGVRSNGLALDPQGRIIVCEPGATPPRLSRLEGGTYKTVADKSPAGANLNGPNDVIVRSDGTIYFTDPNNTMATAQGVYRVDPQGKIHIVDTNLFFPNGVALSPDEKTLYVAESRNNQVFKYPVNQDGTLGQRAVFASTAGGGAGTGGGDGIAIDDQGNVYVATNIADQGVKVYRPNGMLRGNIKTAEIPSNVSFGGADRRTLYITARTSVYSVRLNVPGRP
jgi:gluconolactonase